MDISPMTFSEFLVANGDRNLLEYLRRIEMISPIPDVFFNPLYEKMKMYFVTGGMPESVKMWTQERNTEMMQTALFNIIGAYERDFGKHPHPSEFPKISLLWKSIPSQLSKENKKFIYKVAVYFLIQRENDIFPVEVKAENNVDSTSLRKFKERFSGKVKLRIRFSLDNLKLDNDLLNIPLFMADYADKLIGMALKQKN